MEYVILEPGDTPVEGLPNFTLKEINLMRGKKYSPHELDLIFASKVGLGATVIDAPIPELPPDSKDAPSFERQKLLANARAAQIKEMLRKKGARTDEEKKLAAECQTSLPLR